MRKWLISGIAAASWCVVSISSPASSTILSYGSDWEYTFSDPTGDPNWNRSTGGWLTGKAGFAGGNTGVIYRPEGIFEANTLWASDNQPGADLWLRSLFNTRGYVPGSIIWEVITDSSFDLYANGQSITDYDFDGTDGYSGNFVVELVDGDNVIALALDGSSAAPYFDLQITGELIVKTVQGHITFFEDDSEGTKQPQGLVEVPEPSALVLLGFALLLLGTLPRRRLMPVRR